MKDQVRLCAVWPMENWFGSPLNQIQGCTTDRESYSCVLEQGPLLQSIIIPNSIITLNTLLKWSLKAGAAAAVMGTGVEKDSPKSLAVQLYREWFSIISREVKKLYSAGGWSIKIVLQRRLILC